MKTYASLLLLVLGCGQTAELQDEDVVGVNDVIMEALNATNQPSTLVIYECPDVLMGCGQAAFKSGSTCYPITVTPGKCVDTKIPVIAGSKIPIASCTDANCTNCGQSVSLTAPIITFESTWYSGASWYCQNQCTEPVVCE